MHQSTQHAAGARSRSGARSLGRVAVAALVGLAALLATRLDLGAVIDQRPDTVRAVYVIAADQAVDPSMPAAIRNEIGVVQRWFEEETGGRSLRFAAEDGRLTVDIHRMELTTAAIQGHPDPFAYVAGEVGRVEDLTNDDLPLAFVSTYIWTRHLCGEANSSGVAIIWGGGCAGGPLTGSRAMGDGATDVIAHELVHALGGVRPCAPHYDGDGHVDDPHDVIYGDNDWVRRDVHLDPGRDDYYDTGDASCGDIAGHPAWR